MTLSPDYHLRSSCGIDYIYIPAYAPSGRPIQGRIVSFNEAGKYLWEKLQPLPSFTLEDMVALLLQEYDIDEPTATDDCQSTLIQWTNLGLIRK